jgi:hypothetical protein
MRVIQDNKQIYHFGEIFRNKKTVSSHFLPLFDSLGSFKRLFRRDSYFSFPVEEKNSYLKKILLKITTLGHLTRIRRQKFIGI